MKLSDELIGIHYTFFFFCIFKFFHNKKVKTKNPVLMPDYTEELKHFSPVLPLYVALFPTDFNLLCITVNCLYQNSELF